MKLNGFGWAVDQLKAGRIVTRSAWDGQWRWLELRNQWIGGGKGSINTPYITVREAKGATAPWMPTHADILSEDWTVFNG